MKGVKTIKLWDPFNIGMNFLYVVLEVLFIVWAALDPNEWNLNIIGFGWVDPFMFLALVWPVCVLFLYGVVFVVKRKSYTELSNAEKTNLMDVNPVNSTAERRFQDAKQKMRVVADSIHLRRTGTSKPRVGSFSGTKLNASPTNQKTQLGGIIINMTDMKIYRRGQHDDIAPHILDMLYRTPGYEYNKTRIAAGEHLDEVWAVFDKEFDTGVSDGKGGNIKGGWVIPEVIKTSSFPEGEESLNRKYAGKIEAIMRLNRKLEKHGSREYSDVFKHDG